MENSILFRFKTIVGGSREEVAGLEQWDNDDLEESLEKLEKGRTALAASLEKVEARPKSPAGGTAEARPRSPAGGTTEARSAELEAHARRLRESLSALEPQIDLLRRAVKDPEAIAHSAEDRQRLRRVLAGTPNEMARVGHVVYLVNEWFFDQQPGDRVDRRKEIESVLGNIRATA